MSDEGGGKKQPQICKKQKIDNRNIKKKTTYNRTQAKPGKIVAKVKETIVSIHFN